MSDERSTWLLGVEIGGTKLQLGLGRGDGRLVELERLAIAPQAGAVGILDQIAQAVGPLRERAGAGPVAAVGIGFGGPVDPGRGVVLTSNQVPGWTGFDLASWFGRTLGVERVALQNDADTAALGESRLGAGVGRSPVLYVTIGSGIGGGLIVDGSIYRGAGLGAVEIGHLWVGHESDVEGPPTLERIASGWAIGEAGRRLLGDGLDARGVADAARAGDPVALGILDRASNALGVALAHAVNLLGPRRIILGGGVSLIGEDLWLAPVRRALEPRVFRPFQGTFDLVPAALGEQVVVHGALALAHDLVARNPSPTLGERP